MGKSSEECGLMYKEYKKKYFEIWDGHEDINEIDFFESEFLRIVHEDWRDGVIDPVDFANMIDMMLCD